MPETVLPGAPEASGRCAGKRAAERREPQAWGLQPGAPLAERSTISDAKRPRSILPGVGTGGALASTATPCGHKRDPQARSPPARGALGAPGSLGAGGLIGHERARVTTGHRSPHAALWTGHVDSIYTQGQCGRIYPKGSPSPSRLRELQVMVFLPPLFFLYWPVIIMAGTDDRALPMCGDWL